MTDESKKVGVWTSTSILSIFFVGAATLIVSPAISSIAAAFPDIPLSTITYVATISSLLCIPFSLIAGALVGTKMKYKTLAIISILCIAIGGTSAYFATGNFGAVLASRCFVGAGIGMSVPIGNAVIARLYHGHQMATMQGLGIAVRNLSGVALQMLSGYLVMFSLNYCWLLHLIMIIPLILVLLFFKEPEKDTSSSPAADADGNSEAAPKAKAKIPWFVWFYSFAYGFMFIFYYPLLLNMSSIVTTEGIGTSALAGTILSMYSIGGMIAGFGFGKIYKVLGRKITIPLCVALTAVFMVVAYFTSEPIVMMISVLISGLAVYLIWPACIVEFGEECPPARMGFASGLFYACLNTGAFLTSPYTGIIANIFGKNPRTPLLIGAIIIAIVFVIWTIVIMSRKKAADAAPSESE